MKVLNLQCGARHVFEGWFSSEDEFSDQHERGLLACPLCGDMVVHKLPSAPRLNLGVPREEAAPAIADKQPVVSGNVEGALQAAWLHMTRRIMDQTDDVGDRFAEEARKIHYGETKERGIRGQASREETEALIEEGIEVMAVPLPDALKGPLQ